MILYISIILVAMIIISILNYFISAPIFGFDIGYIIMATVVSTISVIVLDGILAGIAHIIRKKCVNPFGKYYNVTKFQKNFYEKIGVKSFKDYLPDLGKIVGFAKGKIADPKSKEYILEYMYESTRGELGHIVSVPLGFLIIFIFPLKYWLCFGVPVAIVNMALNMLPVISLRYNRYKLNILYNRLCQIENRKDVVSDMTNETK